MALCISGNERAFQKDHWIVHERPTEEELAATALKQAVTREKPAEGLIHHSDHGRQYASYGYQALLR